VENDSQLSFYGAVDGWDSPRFISFFMSLGSFPFLNLFLPSRTLYGVLRKRQPLGAHMP
jgi:hypothetical protein